MNTDVQPSSSGKRPPAWWLWIRMFAVVGGGAAALGAMAQSTGFAMSYFWADRIASHFAIASQFARGSDYGEPSIWKPIRAWEWQAEGGGLFRVYGGWDVFCPWLFLTDWLWLIPIGFGLGMLQSVCFPMQSRRSRIGLILVAGILAAVGWGFYAVTFIWGTTYPIALAQREIGWIFSIVTIFIGGASWVISIPIARSMLRRCIVEVGNPHAIGLFRELWLADGSDAPKTSSAPITPPG